MPDIFVILKAAITVDGYLGSSERLFISGPEDLEEVEQIRSSVDAILVGAGTVKADNPRLLVKNPERQPIRVVLSRSGEFDANLNLLSDGLARTLIYHGNPNLKAAIYGVDFVCLGEQKLDLREVLKHLSSLGVKRLLVEGGADVLAQFYSQGLFSELRLSVGPQFHGREGKRLVLAWGPQLKLIDSKVLKENVVHTYRNISSITSQ